MMLRCFFIPCAAFMVACGNAPTPKPYQQYQGYAQGTTFTIQHQGELDLLDSIEAILMQVDVELSLWDDSSWISRWNRGEQLPCPPYARACLQQAHQLFEISEGAFDPTLLPLSRFWGFGDSLFQSPGLVNRRHLDSLRQMVGLQRCLGLDSLPVVYKKCPNVMLDLNGVAQGFSVDLLGSLLESQGIVDYMIELGGEVKTMGLNPKGRAWQIGIDKPKVESGEVRPLQAIVSMENEALATSGSYRKYYALNGIKYSHVLDPRTGMPVSHQLLSASVVAASCALADGLATALMVLGPSEAKRWATQHPEYGIYLIYTDSSGELHTWMSASMEARVNELNS